MANGACFPSARGFAIDSNSPVRPAMETLETRLLFAINPTGLEQELLEWTQLFRSDTQGHLDDLFTSLNPLTSPDSQVQNALNYFGVDSTQLQAEWLSLTDAPPLAWNEHLIAAAYSHSQLMIQYDTQGHQLPGESPSLLTRIQSFGYTAPGIGVGENVYAFGESVYYTHSGFAIDWGEENPVIGTPDGMQDPAGHRDSLADNSWKEVGFAVIEENNQNTSVGPLVVTQEFGYRSNMGNPFLLGVVWNDTSTNGYFTAGEGYAGVTVRVLDAQSQPVATTTTMTAGGYQVQVPAGTYTVEFSGGALPGTITQPAVIGADNVKVDATPDMYPGLALGAPGYGAQVTSGSSYSVTWTGGAANKTADLYEYGPAGWTGLAMNYATQSGSYSWNSAGQPMGSHIFAARVKNGGAYEPGLFPSAGWLEVTSAPPAPLGSQVFAPMSAQAESTPPEVGDMVSISMRHQLSRVLSASPIGLVSPTSPQTDTPAAESTTSIGPAELIFASLPADIDQPPQPDATDPSATTPTPPPVTTAEDPHTTDAVLEDADAIEEWFAPIR